MQIQQLSVFIENKPGRLAEITEVLAEAGIDIRAISVADTSDFGILRVIVDKPKEAVAALKQHGMTVSLTNVIAVGIDDEPGSIFQGRYACWLTRALTWSTCMLSSAGTRGKPL